MSRVRFATPDGRPDRRLPNAEPLPTAEGRRLEIHLHFLVPRRRPPRRGTPGMLVALRRRISVAGPLWRLTTSRN